MAGGFLAAASLCSSLSSCSRPLFCKIFSTPSRPSSSSARASLSLAAGRSDRHPHSYPFCNSFAAVSNWRGKRRVNQGASLGGGLIRIRESGIIEKAVGTARCMATVSEETVDTVTEKGNPLLDDAPLPRFDVEASHVIPGIRALLNCRIRD